MESSTSTATAGQAVDAATLTEALRRTAADHPDIVAVRMPDDSVSLTWSELLGRVDALAGGLAKLGVARGDCVAIMLANRPEFHIADLAAVTLGATPFSVYTTYPASEIEYLMTDSEARVAIVEQAFLPVMLEPRQNLPGLEHVIVVDGDAPEGVPPGRRGRLRSRLRRRCGRGGCAPRTYWQLIYTSGTTGPPKGVQLTHHAVMFSALGVREVIDFPPGSRVISWLPAAHIAERMAHHYIPVIYAGTVTCAPNPREVLSYLPQVRPNWFFAVPRIWEKLKAGLEAMQAAQPEEQRAPVEAGLAAAVQRVRLRQRGEPVPRSSSARWPPPTSRCSPSSARCSGSTRRSRSTSVPRPRRWRCWSSSTRWGSSWPSCGACRRPAGSEPSTARERCGSGPSDRPLRGSS